MNKTTPGPWSVILDDTGGEFTGWPSITAPDEIDVTVVHRAGFKQTYWGDTDQKTAIANATLMAAAPAMRDRIKRLERENGAIKATLRVNMLRYVPGVTHETIDAEIEKACVI